MQTLLGLAFCGNDKRKPSNVISKCVASTFITSVSNSNFEATPVTVPQVAPFDKTLSIDDNLERLWSIERDYETLIPVTDQFDRTGWSQDDSKVIALWDRETTKVNGHYMVPIPLKNPEEKIPNNVNVAKSMVSSLAKRLNKEGKYDRYDHEIKDLLSQGYAEAIPESEISSDRHNVNYMSHHKVEKGEKIRVVFNGKQKFLGKSLNDRCYQGPNLLAQSTSVLLRFRLHRYAMQGDLKAMYYQVMIPPLQRDMLRFLWFDNQGKIIHLRHTRHVFGGVFSSASTTYALRRIVQDDNSLHPLIKEAIMTAFYVDDLLKSVETQSELRVLLFEMPQELKKNGNYTMHKMVCNDLDILQEVPEHMRAKEAIEITPDIEGKALGVGWDVGADQFCYRFNLPDDHDIDSLTRRQMLSIVSSIFDPLGLISPLVLPGRLLFRQATSRKLDWDALVPPEIRNDWHMWLKSFASLHHLKIPRCVKEFNTEDCTVQLHTFCDASLGAYAAVSYVRSIHNDTGEIKSNLIMAKSRVSPTKNVTIPRLELQACVLAARLAEKVRADTGLIYDALSYWSDSQIVLCYLKNESKRFSLYVANRIAEVSRLSTNDSWKYVPTDQNPSDLPTRNYQLRPEDLDRFWFHGPEWLCKPESEWPIFPFNANDNAILSEDPELCSYALSIALRPTPASITNVFNHYRTFSGMKRAAAIFARWSRFVTFNEKALNKDPISAAEIAEAQVMLIRFAQREMYSKEISYLENGKSVCKSSPIVSLSPTLDDKGLLRVGGRAGLKQILLQGSHKLSLAIINQYHSIAHMGVEWTLGSIRSQFWITKARSLIKNIVKACVTCRRLFSRPMVQQMATLPPERIIPGLPVFNFVGIDVFGPLIVRNYRSNVKRYMCLLTCMISRAVHIEMLCTLETSSMISALRRFIARRGPPQKAFSDNGTNLVGASNELKISMKVFSVDELKRYGVENDFQWIFIPPKSPHFGGAWERMIGVAKRIAKGVQGVLPTKITDESLTTLFCEVENIVNGRPLCKVSDDPNDASVITPNHLLMTRAGAVLPPGRFDVHDTYRKAWRHTQNLVNQFWSKWVRFYLPELQKRQKWFNVTENLAIGDLVLLADVNTPRSLWPLGLVREVTKGRDGLVRSAKLETRSTKEMVRPITQLIMLEAKTEDTSQMLHFINMHK